MAQAKRKEQEAVAQPEGAEVAEGAPAQPYFLLGLVEGFLMRLF